MASTFLFGAARTCNVYYSQGGWVRTHSEVTRCSAQLTCRLLQGACLAHWEAVQVLMERHGYAPETVNASINASELATLIVLGLPALAVGDALQQHLSRAVALLQPASCVRLVHSMWGAAGSLQCMPADAAAALPHSSLRWFPMQDEALQACRGARLLSPLCMRRVHLPLRKRRQ